MLEVLHPSDFRFDGPLAAFDSAVAYVQALRDDPHLANGLNICAGKVTFEAVATALGLGFTPVEDVLAG